MSDAKHRKDLERLQAYHDGELGAWAARGVRRQLARDPHARAELERLRVLGDALRAQAEEVPSPDLWRQIVTQLPAAAPVAEVPSRGFGWGVSQWAGAAALAVSLAWAVVLVPKTGETLPTPSSVLLLDTGRRPAFVLQDDRNATIIWVLPLQPKPVEEAPDVSV
jgi:anti-sigma factor RsiW